MIEKINQTNPFTLDFLQDATNSMIINKINEIIDYLNTKESGK